jgi:hypothetical protein
MDILTWGRRPRFIEVLISSQLADNLNASIHVRAVLTDLFLIDDILKGHARATSSRS